MAKKSGHPDIQLFEFLRGDATAEASHAIEVHLFACAECASFAALVRKIKAANLKAQLSDHGSHDSHRSSHVSVEHPDVSELASFFYAKKSSETKVSAHVAICSSCAEEISLYASANRVAEDYKPGAKEDREDMPAKAWEMIEDWEGSIFAKLKPASEVLGEELLTRLSTLLSKSELKQTLSDRDERVPVLVLSSSGSVLGIEFFEQDVDSDGASILKHAQGSERYDNKPVHVLIDIGEKESVVITELIRSDTISLQQPLRLERSQRASYFIIDDSKD